MTHDSIEHIVAERLDRIFGDDDESEEDRKPAAEAPKSDIDPVKQAVLELESSLQPETIDRLTSSIHSLQKSHGKDPLFIPLLKMMYILTGHLKPGRPDVNRAALQSVRSNIECMEALETGQTLPDAEKRKRVHKEIESFKAFRESIKISKPPEKGPEDAPTALQPAAAGPTATDTPAPVFVSRDLDAFREDISVLGTRINGIMKTLEVQSASGAEFRNTVSQIGKQVGALSSLPGAVRILIKKAMEKPPHKTGEPGVEPLKIENVRSSVVEAVQEGLNAGLKEFREMPSGLREVQEAVSDAFNRFEKRINELHEEIRSVKEAVRSIRSEVNDLRTPITPAEATEEGAFPVEEMCFGAPFEENELKGPAVEAEGSGDEEVEPADELEEYTPPNRPGLPTGDYFLFAVGGKKYAVDERYVIKASEAGADLLKKAGTRGGLTISDSTTGLFNTKKGVEPAWRFITSGEIKRDLFRLVPESALDGLAGTEGEGILYLGVGDERIMLFTDHPAVKITLGHEDEVHMTGISGSRSGAVCGSIQRSGEQSEFYLIISPEKFG